MAARPAASGHFAIFVHSRAPSYVVSPTSVARVWPRTSTQLRVARSAEDNAIRSASSYVSMAASQTQLENHEETQTDTLHSKQTQIDTKIDTNFADTQT